MHADRKNIGGFVNCAIAARGIAPGEVSRGLSRRERSVDASEVHD